jgi:MFS family permease
MSEVKVADAEKTGDSYQQQDDGPPDGGLVAWLNVNASFWCWFNTFGITNAFGVFVNYYQTKFPDQNPSLITLIGSVQPFLIVFFGFLAGPLWDAGYCHALIAGGTAVTAFGYFMVSICDAYWQVMLAQGIVVGFGACLLYIPGVAIIPQYFNKRRALANGIGASGASLGGVIYPIAFHQLLQHLSFGWSVRILGFMVLGTGSLAFLTIRVRVKPTKRALRFDYRSFIAEPAYGLYTIALFFTLIAQYTPPFFIQDYVKDKGIMSDDMSNYLLPILNATSLIGRIAPNLISDRIGGLNVLFPSVASAAVLTFAWIGIDSAVGCIVFVSLYGFFIGCILSLPAFVITSLCPDPKVAGTRIGNSFAAASFGMLLGPPVAGAILRGPGWLSLQIFAAIMLALAAVALLIVRVYVAGWNIKRRV